MNRKSKSKTRCPMCGDAMTYSEYEDQFFGCQPCGVNASGGHSKKQARETMEAFISACAEVNEEKP